MAKSVLSKFKNKLFINFAFDITRECDCISTKNEKIVSKDIGILASRDIVSLDKATIDIINKDGDLISKEKPHTSYNALLEYAGEKKLGSLEYKLVEI